MKSFALDKTEDASSATEQPARDVPAAHDETLDDEAPPEVGPARRDVPGVESRRYTVLREFARGGLGRILEAKDHKLHRSVAIKELRVASGGGQLRFRREALVTARLQHPSIVPLYDLGRWESGEPYYAMRLVPGRPLDAVIAAAASVDQRLALLPHVIAVADAMAYAHSQRIVHRDLKPANVLVGEFGETVVIDWGLAKDLADESDVDELDGPFRRNDVGSPLTQAGEVLGTPVYMAPEQAMGEELDERADVYAIGAILYQVLSGVWPHSGATTAQVIARLVAGEAITPITQQQPDVPPDLAAIVDKAMRFERDARYPSAAELAADLRRFQTGQLVAAHRYSSTALLRRWVGRHRAAVGVAAALLAVLAVTTTLGVRSIIHERDATRVERDRLILAQAIGALDRDPTAAVAWLKTYPTDGADVGKARDLALEARARGLATYVLPRDPDQLEASMGRFSPDGSRFAQPSTAGLRIIDLATGAPLSGPSVAASIVQWSPDGKQLLTSTLANRIAVVGFDGAATVSLDGNLSRQWRSVDADFFSVDGATVVVPTRDRHLVRYARGGGMVEPVWTPFPLEGYTRRGERIASLSTDSVLTWWEPAARVAHPLAVPTGVALAANEEAYALLGDGATLAAGTTDGRLCVWSLPDGSLRIFDNPDHAAIRQLVASRDGRTVVTFAGEDTLRSWQVDAGTSARLPMLGKVNDIGIAPDGRHVAVGLTDHDVVIVDTGTGDHHVVGRHAGAVVRVAMSPDGRWIASDGNDGTTRLWRVPVDVVELAANSGGGVADVASSSDGATLVSVGTATGGRYGLWIRGDARVALDGEVGNAWQVAFAGDGRTFATLGGHRIRTWNAATGQPNGSPLETGARILWLAISRDGHTIASLHENEVRIWDVAARTSRVVATIHGGRGLALAPDERSLVASDDRVVRLVPLDGGPARELSGTLDSVTGAPSIRFSPDGRAVVAGSATGQVLRWDVATGAVRELDRRRAAVDALAFSRDGRWLAVASQAGELGLIDTSTGAVRVLAGHVGPATTLGFLADAVVSGGADGTIRIWDVTSGIERSRLRVDGEVSALDVRDGSIAAGSTTGMLYRWPVAALGTTPPAELAAFLDELTPVHFDAAAHLVSLP